MHSKALVAKGIFRGRGMSPLFNRIILLALILVSLGLADQAQAYMPTEGGPSFGGDGDVPYCYQLRVAPQGPTKMDIDTLEYLQNRSQNLTGESESQAYPIKDERKEIDDLALPSNEVFPDENENCIAENSSSDGDSKPAIEVTYEYHCGGCYVKNIKSWATRQVCDEDASDPWFAYDEKIYKYGDFNAKMSGCDIRVVSRTLITRSAYQYCDDTCSCRTGDGSLEHFKAISPPEDSGIDEFSETTKICHEYKKNSYGYKTAQIGSYIESKSKRSITNTKVCAEDTVDEDGNPDAIVKEIEGGTSTTQIIGNLKTVTINTLTEFDHGKCIAPR